MARFLFALLLCPAFPAPADDLVLAPGRSITLLDAADPTARVLITAPPDAPLNLSALLSTDPKEGMRSVVTRMQLQQARGIAVNADGSLWLSGAALPGPAQRAVVLEGGVLIYDAGKYTLHAARPAAGKPALVPGPAGGRVQITKAGTTREQAERDLRQCRAYAEGAAAHFLTPAYKSATYNMALATCLRGFGYGIRSPAG